MINILEPKNVLLKQFVDSIYIFKKGIGSMEFTAYPTPNSPVGLFRGVNIGIAGRHVCIENSDAPNYTVMACNQFSSDIHMKYLQFVDEIAINFKPLGLASFLQVKPKNEKVFLIEVWNKFLPGLFNNVFAIGDPSQQLYHIEKFLLTQYIPLAGETILIKALELLNDVTIDHKMQEIARIVGIEYKQLYRLFKQNTGCSLAHYRKLVRFRTSVASKINKGNKVRLVDICYDSGYTDQSHFIKQLKGLTGEKPTNFFKGVTSFGNDKVIFKID